MLLRVPDARSPKSAGRNDDTRVLGIAVQSPNLMPSEGGSARCD
jgi:hypothetical protein